MKKNDSIFRSSDSNFNEPQRQSNYAIVLIIYNRVKGLINRIWPLLLIGLFSGNFSLSSPDKFTLIFLGLTFITGVSGIIAYYRYFFWIEDNHLIIKKGVFSKSVSQIPFDRIQTVDFEQNIIHQLFDVVGLKIETAGSTSTEIKMSALDKTIAQQLRDHILSQKLSTNTDVNEDLQQVTQMAGEEIYRIKFDKLLKIGFTENHLRSFFVILFFLYWIFENIKEAGLNLEEYGGAMYKSVIQNILNIGAIVTLFIIISILVSVTRVSLKHFDLRLLRNYNGFKLIQGLFNKKEIAALDSKIQLIEWSKNLLQRILGFHTLVLKQASSVELSAAKSIQVPGVSFADIIQIKNYLFPNRAEESIHYYKLNKQFLYRPIFLFSILILLAIAVPLGVESYMGSNFSFNSYKAFIPFSLLILFFIATRIKKYHKASYGLNDKMTLMKGGVFGFSEWLIMHHKIQSLSIRQSPFMRRKGIANLIINTASGTRVIPYIEIDRAHYLFDYLTYKIETSDEKWM